MEIQKLLVVIGVVIGFIASGCAVALPNPKKVKKEPIPEYFSLCTATLDGKNFTEILKDPKRQISHPKVSDDHKWITFTRFNNFNTNGVAVEKDGYDQTEVMICRIDGSEVQSLTPPKKGVGNCISHWTPDNKGLIYVSSDNPQKMGQVYIMDVATRKRTKITTPPGINAADPHMVGNLVVYAGKKKGQRSVIKIMDVDGSNHRQVSSTPENKSKGEHDPRISPDQSKVAFLRFGQIKGAVHSIVVDLKTGKETNLSDVRTNNIEALPEWSSDSKLLVFWHLDRQHKFLNSGIYTIRPDGTHRRKIPLPQDYFYTMPSFLPGTGSGKDAKIIFDAQKYPAVIRKRLRKLLK